MQVFVFSINHPQYEQLLAIVAIVTLAIGVTVLIIQIRIMQIRLLVVEGIVTAGVFSMLVGLAGINTTNRYLIVALPLVLITMAATLIRRKWAWSRGINIIGALTIAFYVIYGTNFVLNTKFEDQQASWNGEPIVIMGWDATPLQYYLGETALTSFELEKLSLPYPHPSYLIIMTPNSRTIPIVASAVLLYEDREEGIKILRWYAPSG
jgi:hypothetical protein